MTTKEIIDWFIRNRNYDYSGQEYKISTPTVEETVPVPESLVEEIILKLKELEELAGIIDTCYLGIVKAYTMLRLGEMRDEKK